MEENLEKKSKRPRIGGLMPPIEENSSRYENAGQEGQGQGGYNNSYQQDGGYQQQGGYRQQQGGYRQQQGGYRQQQGGYRQQQGGYRQQQGGYRQQQGGYRQQQGGYRQQQGGYRQQQGGYRPQQGGYQQQGGYRQQQGGYRQQQGGYRQQQGGYRQQQGGFKKRPQNQPRQQMRFVPRPQPVEYVEPIIDPTAEIRLNKFMANAGICSRREADELITKGLVKVNGEAVTELGVKITAKDTVEYNDKIVTSERKVYLLLNKPKDCVTTSDDPNGRKTVMDLVKGACEERIYPVGRLDRNTTGVLLLTNDGDLASKLTHPKYVKKKIYQVWVDKPISEEDMQHIADGVELDDGPIHADAVSYVSPTDRKQAGIEIHSGRNRVVRRIFESLGYHVVKLDRVYFAGLTKKNLPRGRWRYLTQEEVNFLKQNSFE
ncbi:MAG: pseudouridine synthase [Sodaliphilus sp.]|nr:pseudouridine synthase [Sodaliphilus sp.]